MIKSDEAFLVLDKLHSEGAVVAFIGSLYGVSFVCKGRIVRLSRTGFVVFSLDEGVNFTVDLAHPDLAFEYGEPGHLHSEVERGTIPKSALRAAAIGILLPFRVTPEQVLADSPPTREKLFVIEIPEGAE